jgi:hypothetical protein
MMRNSILFLVVIVLVGVLPACFTGPDSLARGESATINATAALQATASTPLLQDNFDDNFKWKRWKVYTNDPNCWVVETNKRLEFRTKGKTSGAFAGYIADDWWVDPNTDFSMKVDLYYDIDSMEGGWISFGLTPNPEEPRDQYISVGIGCANRYSSYWREWKDGYEIRWDFESRFQNRVTMYISYSAWNDEVYVSDAGYGSDDAWQVIPDFLRGRWARRPLFVFLGVTANGPTLNSGNAYIDNFVIDSGRLVKIGEPNVPPGPIDPNDPNSAPGDYTDPDVAAHTFVLSPVVKRNNPGDSIVVVASLPKAIRPADVNDAKPLMLWPGAAQATSQAAYLWLGGNTIVTATFQAADLLTTVPDDGPIELHFLGWLKDGRTFGGAYTVTTK